jgi:hypothetical protein
MQLWHVTFATIPNDFAIPQSLKVAAMAMREHIVARVLTGILLSDRYPHANCPYHVELRSQLCERSSSIISFIKELENIKK